jgi:ABC-2 type transport system ATP-binding protein
MDTLLEVQIQHAGYAGHSQAVSNINFSLKRGELLGLIGSNGAGKSTVIKAILGLLPVMSGAVSFMKPDSRYAYIPEQPILYDELTLWEHLDLAASAYGLGRREFLDKADWLLALFRLEDARHDLPGSFSKGMQQKTMLIVGLLIGADVYIIDEPFMGLDPRAIRDLLSLLDQERRRGAGVLMSTHALDTAERICDSLILMDDGKLIMQGNLQQIRAICGTPEASLLTCFNAILENLE